MMAREIGLRMIVSASACRRPSSRRRRPGEHQAGNDLGHHEQREAQKQQEGGGRVRDRAAERQGHTTSHEQVSKYVPSSFHAMTPPSSRGEPDPVPPEFQASSGPDQSNGQCLLDRPGQQKLKPNASTSASLTVA
jgi:hypothetical protein